MLDRVRQLAIQIELGVDSSLEECRENMKTLRSIEDYGLVRFSSKLNAFSRNVHKGMAIEDYLSYDLAWINPNLRRI